MNTWPCISHYELHIATVTRSSRALSDALSYTFANMQDGFKWNYFDPMIRLSHSELEGDENKAK